MRLLLLRLIANIQVNPKKVVTENTFVEFSISSEQLVGNKKAWAPRSKTTQKFFVNSRDPVKSWPYVRKS